MTRRRQAFLPVDLQPGRGWREQEIVFKAEGAHQTPVIAPMIDRKNRAHEQANDSQKEEAEDEDILSAPPPAIGWRRRPGVVSWADVIHFCSEMPCQLWCAA
jgi:hypothetical protein